MILVSPTGKCLKSFAVLYVLVNSFKNDDLFHKEVTHHHVEIHVETHYSIETLSEKVRFDYFDRSYKRRKNVRVFNITTSRRTEWGV